MRCNSERESSCVQAYGGVFPGSPPLDPNSYSKCYAMELDGFVSVSSTQNIQTSSSDNNTYQFANQFRYCSMQLHHTGSSGSWHCTQGLPTLNEASCDQSYPADMPFKVERVLQGLCQVHRSRAGDAKRHHADHLSSGQL